MRGSILHLDGIRGRSEPRPTHEDRPDFFPGSAGHRPADLNIPLDQLGHVKVADFDNAKGVAAVCEDPLRSR
jgi:hypothetical protein